MWSNEPFLMFEAGGSLFALPGSVVAEIRRYDDQSGVLLADVSALLGGAPAVPGPQTCVIILDRERAGTRQTTALIVDAATDVVSFGRDEVVQKPDFGPHIELPYLVALVRRGDRFAIVLDLIRFLRDVETEVGAA